MNTAIDLISHLVGSVCVGIIAWRLFFFKKKNLVWFSLAAAALGGILNDVDHFIDYYLAFGWNFRLDYFLNGYEFLKSLKAYVIFHAYEYAIIFIIIAIVLKSKKWKFFFMVLAISLLLHIGIDLALTDLKWQTYSITYRIEHNFNFKYFLSEKNYIKMLIEKAEKRM